MLRSRIELLERILHSHGIDPDAAIHHNVGNDKSGSELDTEWAPPCSNVDDELCGMFDGALTLDESLNFDQDGEVRYFGPTSGRLLFQFESKGRLRHLAHVRCANISQIHPAMASTSPQVRTQKHMSVCSMGARTPRRKAGCQKDLLPI